MAAKASRAAFGEALVELGARDPRIVTLDADLSKSTMTVKFAKTPSNIRRHPPKLGEHTDEVLAELAATEEA